MAVGLMAAAEVGTWTAQMIQNGQMEKERKHDAHEREEAAMAASSKKVAPEFLDFSAESFLSWICRQRHVTEIVATSDACQ
ncbi:ATP-binding cassette, subfamily B [Sesbania bispinosa]|nr:ATP-binding cassette, subfamily B [Sesbania bispinosa]